MTRVHAEQITVERGVVAAHTVRSVSDVGAGIEGPLGFSWRGRAYSVVEVLDHWLEAGAWWRRAGRTGDPAGAGRVLGIDDGEREVWRVEASTGRRTSPRGVFDLRCDGGSGQWSLIRVHD